MTIGEQIAHLRGLAEGLGITAESSAEGKLLTAMLEVLGSINQQLCALEEDVEFCNEGIEAVTEELMSMEEDYYGEDDGTWPYDGEDDEDDDEDFDDEEEDFDDEEDFDEDEILYLVKCPKCGDEMEMDEDTLLEGNIRCESCGQKFELEILFDEEEEDQSED